ncbi:MAG TPA: GNAT family N-acetyltransferase [Gemmatimonadaceae bacterium]|nr:GNAT family N-acetyltransferase [Gemmatimonadaceae bacterium]
MITVRRLTTVTAQIHELALVLIDCVEGGASVSFMLPLSLEKATTFWRQVARDVAANARALLIAEDSTGIVGTVQLVFAQSENQPHRADISKLLVHSRARRLGIGEALMHEAEHVARECGRTLLVLDTASGDAERLYVRMGWRLVGAIPDYALWPGGGLCATSFYYRKLD